MLMIEIGREEDSHNHADVRKLSLRNQEIKDVVICIPEPTDTFQGAARLANTRLGGTAIASFSERSLHRQHTTHQTVPGSWHSKLKDVMG